MCVLSLAWQLLQDEALFLFPALEVKAALYQTVLRCCARNQPFLCTDRPKNAILKGVQLSGVGKQLSMSCQGLILLLPLKWDTSCKFFVVILFLFFFLVRTGMCSFSEIFKIRVRGRRRIPKFILMAHDIPLKIGEQLFEKLFASMLQGPWHKNTHAHTLESSSEHLKAGSKAILHQKHFVLTLANKWMVIFYK